MSCEEFQTSAILDNAPDLLDILNDGGKIFQSLRKKKNCQKKEILQRIETQMHELDKLSQLCKEVKTREEDKLKRLSRDIKELKEKVYTMKVQEKLLQEHSLLLKKDLDEVPKESVNEDDLAQLMSKMCTLKEGIRNDQNKLKQEINQYKRGIYFYKTYLHCDVVFHSQDTLSLVLFDTSAKTTPNEKVSITFSTKDHGASFECLSMEPKVNTQNQLITRYLETGDVQGLVVEFWKAVRLLKQQRKVLATKN